MSTFNQLQNVLFSIFFIPALYYCAPGGDSKFKSHVSRESMKEMLSVTQMHDLLRELLL